MHERSTRAGIHDFIAPCIAQVLEAVVVVHKAAEFGELILEALEDFLHSGEAVSDSCENLEAIFLEFVDGGCQKRSELVRILPAAKHLLAWNSTGMAFDARASKLCTHI